MHGVIDVCSVISAANVIVIIIAIVIAAAVVIAEIFKVQKVLLVGQEYVHPTSAEIKVCRISSGRFV